MASSLNQSELSSRRIVHRRLRAKAAVFSAVFLAIAVSSACRVRLIGDYDDFIDKGISDVQQTAELYFAKLESDPMTPYDQSVYQDVNSRLAVLKSRAASLGKYQIIVDQITNLQSQFDAFRKLDSNHKRPVAAETVKTAESSIAVSVESILRLELALKRGVTNPSGITGSGK